MPTDYIVLAIVAFVAISGGLFLLRQAKNYRQNHEKNASSEKTLTIVKIAGYRRARVEIADHQPGKHHPA